MDGSFRLSLSDDDDDDASRILDTKGNLDELFSEFMEDSGTIDKSAGKSQAVPSTSSAAATSSTSSSAAATLLAKVVYAYKLVNGENIAQGRIGLAVVQQSADHSHLILYRTRNEVLCTLTLPASTASIQPNGEYLQFRDDAQHLWSVRFDVAADRADFLHTIGHPIGATPSATIPPTEVAVDAAKSAPTPPTEAAGKRALVNRMAKMGQQLPQLPVAATAADPSASSADSSDSESQPATSTAKWKPLVAQRPSAAAFPASLLAATTNNTLIAYTTTTQPTGFGSQAGCLMPAGNHQQQQQQQQFSDSAAMHAHFAETRMQNTELRMNLARMDARLDRVLDRMASGGLSSSPAAAPSSPPPPPTQRSDCEADLIVLEERVLALRKENRELRLRCEKQQAAAASERGDRQQLEQCQARLAASERAEREKCAQLDDLQAQLNVAQEAVQKQRQEIEKLRQIAENRVVPAAPAVETATAVNATVKTVLTQFYQHLQAALEQSPGEQLRTESVLKLARTLIKREAQNVMQ